MAELAELFIGNILSRKSRGKCLLSKSLTFSPDILIEVKA